METEAHPRLTECFKAIKEQFKDIHVSQVWRGQVDQDNDYKDGKSRLKWPNSQHNCMYSNKPRSRAIDVFQLLPSAQALWPQRYFREISDWCIQSHLPLMWGGNWITFKDFDHFVMCFPRPLHVEQFA